jgi:pimeloyl-ACP methyl ester carboxylesterase
VKRSGCVSVSQCRKLALAWYRKTGSLLGTLLPRRQMNGGGYANGRVEDFPPLGECVTVGHERVHLWDRGSGPAVVLLHGASANLRDWTFSLAEPLSRKYRVIAFDRPGFGWSTRTGSPFSVARQVTVMRAALRERGVEKAILVGHSFGGAVVMAWALAHPDEVIGVLPVSGVTMPYEGLAFRAVAAAGLEQPIVNLYSGYMRLTADRGGTEGFVSRIFWPQSPPEGYLDHIGVPLALQEGTMKANAEDLANLNRTLLGQAPFYSRLRMPVEIIHGDRDFVSAELHAKGLARAVPQANLSLLKNVGHMAHHAAPQALERALSRLAGSA